MKRFQILWRFIQFFFSASTRYRVHSPFVFDFTENILDDGRQYYAFEPLETLRRLLKDDKRSISVTDFGAGSNLGLGKQRKISSIANSSLSSPRFCQMLFKMIHHYHCKNILELGTSLGLSTLYMAMADSENRVISIEGCPNIAAIAQENFHRLQVENIELISGQFKDHLPDALKKLGQIDLAFIDGHHQKVPTLKYFKECLKHSNYNTILIFDDIYWSKEMVEAWSEIKAHPKVSLSIDLFFMGMVFFREEQKIREHYKLVPASWKPWVMGFFR